MFRLAFSSAARSACIARPALRAQTGAFARWASTLPRSDVESRVLSVFATYAGDKANLTSTTTFKDLGLDSLDAVELMVAVEEEFGIEIPDKESDEIQSVKDAVDYIAAQSEAR